MPTVDEAWASIYEPTQNLKEIARTEPWDVSRARLLEEVDAYDKVVVELLRRLDELSDRERADLLVSDELDSFVYKVVEETADPNPDSGSGSGSTVDESAAADPPANEAAWGDYLATNGPAWDGSAQSWPAFREWFAYYAAEAGVAPHATALLDYLESLTASERVTTLADHYGIVIAQPSTSSGPHDGGTPVTLDAQTEQQLTSALERGLAEVPGASELSQAEIDEVLARVREAMKGGAAT